MANELRVLTDDERKVVDTFKAQHGFHGLIAERFFANGGMDLVDRCFQEKPFQMIKLLTALTPGLVPTHGMQGDVTINVHPSLQPTPLDGEYEVQDAD